MKRKLLYIGTPGILLYSKSIKKCFEKLNFEIFEPEYIKFKDQNSIQKRISRQNFLDNFFHKQNVAFIKDAKKFKPDYVFVLNNSRMNGEFLQYCNDNQIPVFMYCIDSIRWCDKALEHMHYYTEIFSYEPSDSAIEFKPNQFVKFLPLGYDKEIYLPDIQKSEKTFDLCFVGRLDKHRLNILETAAKYAWENKLKFAVYTSIQLFHIPSIWLLPKLLVRRLKYNYKYPHLMKYIINRPILGKELTNLYNDSKICFNIHVATHAGMHTGPNPRTFELLGCGAFEIIDEGHIDKTKLKANVDLVEFKTPTDLVKKIDFYLNNKNLREKIAANGHTTVKENYELLNLINKIAEQMK